MVNKNVGCVLSKAVNSCENKFRMSKNVTYTVTYIILHCDGDVREHITHTDSTHGHTHTRTTNIQRERTHAQSD